MTAPVFSFGPEQLNRIFPFHILIDDTSKITSLGPSLATMEGLNTGGLLADFFDITLPEDSLVSFHSLKEMACAPVLLHFKGTHPGALRGSFESIGQDQLLFTGMPATPPVKEIPRDGTINDRERLWNSALDSDGFGIWQYDLKNVDGVNFSHYKKALGYGSHEKFGYDEWSDSTHADDRERVIKAFEAYIKGEATQFREELRLMDKSGVYRYFVTRGFIVERDGGGNPTLIVGTITDIDRQKQFELQLKETANRLSFLIKNMDSGMVVEDKEGKIILVNDIFCKFLDIKEPPEKLTGMNYLVAAWQRKFLYKDPEAAILRIYHILEQRQLVTDELVELADGRSFERDFVPIFLDGRYEGHLWKYTEVTERMLAKKKLEEQKIFYEYVLNNIPADIVAFSPEHKYLFINPMAIKDAELRKWLIGKTDEDFCLYRNKPMSIAEERKAIFDKVMATKKLHSFEEKMTGPGGAAEYHLRNMYPVLNEQNEVVQVIGFGLNITDRKKIELQLKINEKRFRDLFNYSQAYICTHDLAGKLLTVNPAICELLGYSEADLTGRMLTDFLPVEDVEKFQADYLDKVISDGSARGVFRVLNRDRKKSFLLYKNFKVEEENSEPYIIGFSQDITDRIKTEKELLVTKKVTEEAHKAKETFLANMSHEIRTPMTGILGIAGLLSKTKLDDQQKKYTKLISESANNLLTIVNDVLDIEKIGAGKLDLELIPFKLEDRVFTTLQSFQFKAEDKNIHLALNSTLPDDIMVVGDPYRLSQILNNLLSNALKFTHDGEISINIDSKKDDGKTTLIEIQVRDTGIGIGADKLAEIFNPFTQASTDTTRKYGGTGLGLTICKNLVEMQGGKMSVSSILNEGTTFTFEIPYEKGSGSLPDDDNKQALNFKDLESVRILVAEDVELNQFLVKHILESWGCVVTVVSNGREAVEKVQKNYYDLILMDIQMPEMDGITATKMIRDLKMADNAITDKSVITKKIRKINTKDKSATPIIALTANALKGDGERYVSLGMSGYITKPYTEEKLFHAINHVIKSEDKIKIKVVPAGRAQNETLIDPNEQLFDLTLINTIGKDDPEFVKNIISLFLTTMPESLEILVTAGNDKNYELAAKTAHKMKSSIDIMGINSLNDPIKALENNKTGNEDTDLLIEKVKNIVERVIVQLNGSNPSV